MNITVADLADVPAIQNLARVIWRECYPGIISPEQIEYMLAWMYSIEQLTREIKNNEVTYLKLELKGEVIGYASFGPISPGKMKIHKLYIHPEHHREGYASALLAWIENFARSIGTKELTLGVNKKNEAAIAAYRKNGFAIASSVCTDIGGGFRMDDYVMAKAL